jgi:hypothetical protein
MIAKQKRKVNRYKTEVCRLKKKITNAAPNTPTKKINRLLKQIKMKTSEKNRLVNQQVLVDEVIRKVKDRNLSIERILSQRIIRKYRMKSWLKHMKVGNRYVVLGETKRRGNKDLDRETKRLLTEFFERDDVSRSTAGKAETITRKKVRKQRRYLLSDLNCLYPRFKEMYPNLRIGYSTFYKQKPFWVLKPNVKDRETCQCVKCQNLKFKAEKLAQEGVLRTKNLCELLKDRFCEVKMSCVYGKCQACRYRPTPHNPEMNCEKIVHWKQWTSETLDLASRTDGVGPSVVTRVSHLQTISGKLIDLYEEFDTEMSNKGWIHLYNIGHQSESIANLKRLIVDKEMLFTIDFAENYNNKYHEEIQSIHFGASREQTTIHDGVVYRENEAHSFATISNCRRHDPPAIWAYMLPILKWAVQSTTRGVHFVSDGPTTQYRQKGNFFLFSKLLCQEFPQLDPTRCSWNFTEAGHGKGAADGVGASIKSAADRIVANGTSLPDARSVYEQLTAKASSKVKLFYVSAREVQEFADKWPQLNGLKPVGGTMKTHQILIQSPGIIRYRELGCFCSYPVLSSCECYDLKVHDFNTGRSGKPILEAAQNASTPLRADSDQSVETDQSGIPLMEADQSGTPLMEADQSGTPLMEGDQSGTPLMEGDQSGTPLMEGDWVIVLYDDHPYVGCIIENREDEPLVSVMYQRGRNKFMWPSVKDVIPYPSEDVICKIMEPKKQRLYSLNPQDWDKFTSYL